MEAEENAIDSNIKMIEEAIYKFPLSLNALDNTNLEMIVNDYLPYSMGMEFECYANKFNEDKFKKIPDIMDVDGCSSEIRFRIPNGIKGLVCLWHILIEVKKQVKIDLGSSNHYHTDFTDVWSKMSQDFKKAEIKWVLEELKTWGTAVNYDMINSWYRWNTLSTLEIRIGEPSFDYDVIVKRLIQCCDISKRVKFNLLSIEEQQQVRSLTKELELLKATIIVPKLDSNDEVKNIINNRVIKIY